MPSEKVEEILSWLQKASDDLEAATILFNTNRATQWHQVLFFCQQAVEKTLKAFLVWKETKFDWTHDLEKIGNQCRQIDPSLKTPIAQIIYLSDYAWEFRYPGEDPEPTRKEASQGIQKTKKFVRDLLKTFPKDVIPKPIPAKKRKK